ncbi:MAG: molecular chaperone GrpE [Arenicella sp.]|jgi:molecular chaperone GrpE
MANKDENKNLNDLEKEMGKVEKELEEIVEEANEGIDEMTEEVEEVSELEKAKAEVAEFKDKYLRLYSEFENFRRRTNKEKIEFLSSANKDLIKELLPVIDDFERADDAFDQEVTSLDQIKEGYDLVYKKLKNTLGKQGLKEIESQKGEVFDVELHEAVTQFPAPSEDMKGKVIDQIEKGYMLGEKVVRFTKVVVGN